MAWPTTTIVTTQMDAATDDPSQARAEIKQMADNVNAIKDSRSAASGIASLDAGGKVPTTELPTIPANQGGTGQTGYTVGDMLYASAAGTLTKLNAATAGYVLTSNGAGAAPSWQAAGGGFVAGTRMSFNQTAAPTGWTKDIDAALNDSIMRIVTGTAGSGGSNAFTDFNGQTSVGATTLSTAQIPTLPLEYYSYLSGGVYASRGKLSPRATFNYVSTNDYNALGWIESSMTAADGNSRVKGGGGYHTHAITTSIKYNDFIIASKD